ncbi:hypothetical protein Ocin01_19892 [Orchesella cincta]|uniref:Uncharacterized protein n=1 Tax=Orchesella cincta TaxID=48709 RepID=A0A1D2M1F0_ORCCI|nr:hypothetical protein Ocin01_19892 [Orchesella cincta]
MTSMSPPPAPGSFDLETVKVWYSCKSQNQCSSWFYSVPALPKHFMEKHPDEELKLPDNLDPGSIGGENYFRASRVSQELHESQSWVCTSTTHAISGSSQQEDLYLLFRSYPSQDILNFHLKKDHHLGCSSAAEVEPISSDEETPQERQLMSQCPPQSNSPKVIKAKPYSSRNPLKLPSAQLHPFRCDCCSKTFRTSSHLKSISFVDSRAGSQFGSSHGAFSQLHFKSIPNYPETPAFQKESDHQTACVKNEFTCDECPYNTKFAQRFENHCRLHELGADAVACHIYKNPVTTTPASPVGPESPPPSEAQSICSNDVTSQLKIMQSPEDETTGTPDPLYPRVDKCEDAQWRRKASTPAPAVSTGPQGVSRTATYNLSNIEPSAAGNNKIDQNQPLDIIGTAPDAPLSEDEANQLMTLCRNMMPNQNDIPKVIRREMFPFCASCKDLAKELWECNIRMEKIKAKIESKAVEEVILSEDPIPSEEANNGKRFMKLRSVIYQAAERIPTDEENSRYQLPLEVEQSVTGESMMNLEVKEESRSGAEEQEFGDPLFEEEHTTIKVEVQPENTDEGTLLVEAEGASVKLIWTKDLSTSKAFMECSFENCNHSVPFGKTVEEMNEAYESSKEHIQRNHKDEADRLAKRFGKQQHFQCPLHPTCKLQFADSVSTDKHEIIIAVVVTVGRSWKNCILQESVTYALSQMSPEQCGEAE